MPITWRSGTSSTSRVSAMARLSRALPSLERCERPVSACLRSWGVQPGILAQGPDEKCGFAGHTAGFAMLIRSILPDGPPLVGEGCPADRNARSEGEGQLEFASPGGEGGALRECDGE